MRIQTLYDCFLTKLMALYDVETQLVKALPKMVKNADNEKLKEGLRNHLLETEGHVERLETIFDQFDMKPKKLKTEAIRGLVADAAWCMEQDGSPAALDSLIIGSARYVEHYEVAGYSVLLEWAKMLSLDEAATLISQTLDEEKNADETLAQASEEVNAQANEEVGDEEE